MVIKGKAPKEEVEAMKELKDSSAFHTSVSVALGTALQHLADSLSVQLVNFVLRRHDFYLKCVKPVLHRTPEINSRMLIYSVHVHSRMTFFPSLNRI